MAELILYAIPAFVLLLVVELLSFRLADDHDHGLVGYEAKDTRTSLTMGGGNVAISAAWKPTRVAFHEFRAIAHDVRQATSWRHKLGYVFRGPGWSPDGSGGGTRG